MFFVCYPESVWSLWRVSTFLRWYLEVAATQWRTWLAAGPTRQPCYWTLKSATNCLTLVRSKKIDYLIISQHYKINIINVIFYRVLWIFWTWLYPSSGRQHQDWESEHSSVSWDDPGNGHRQSSPTAPLTERTDATCTTGHAQYGGYHGNQPWWTRPTKWTRFKVTKMLFILCLGRPNSDIGVVP